MVTNEYLYKNFPQLPEGKLSHIKARIVSEVSLAELCRKLKLTNYLLLGRGEEITGGRQKEAIQADLFEAFLGALYLDQGYVSARRFLVVHLSKQIQLVHSQGMSQDYKSILQELCQKKYKSLPQYVLRGEDGPDHNKTFFIEVLVNGKLIADGKGKNKRKAEQNSAKNALSIISKKRS